MNGQAGNDQILFGGYTEAHDIVPDAVAGYDPYGVMGTLWVNVGQAVEPGVKGINNKVTAWQGLGFPGWY
jgi:hypothetical protein